MPLPNLDQRRAYHFDALLELRDYDATAASTTTSETGVAFESRKTDVFKVVVHHAAIGGTVDGSNYWTISVEVSDVQGGTYTEVASTGALAAASAQIELAISGVNVERLDADADWIRVTATETGSTAGNLTYGAYITPAT